jgi:MFS family permease
MFTATSWLGVLPGIILYAGASLYNPAFNAIIAESLPQGKRGTAFGAYRFITSIPAIFMPVVSGYYLDRMGIGSGVRVGLMMFAVAAGIAALIRQLVLQETLGADKRDDAKVSRNQRGVMESFRRQPRTIYAMLIVAVVSGFATTMTWSFLAPYAHMVVGLTTTQYGLLQSIAMAISVPLYLVSGMLADRYGRVPCILVSRALGPFDSLSLLLFRDYNQLLAAYSVIGVAQGLGGGRIRSGGNTGDPAWQALIADLVPSRDRGKVMGFMGTVTGLLSLPGSVIGGFVYAVNPGMVLLAGSILEAIQVPIILFFVKDVKEKHV